MSLFSGRAEWHYKGTCIWVASFFSIAVNAFMIFTYLRHRQTYSVATLYVVLIGIMGICMTLMAETTFLQEAVHPMTAPDWLFALKRFSLTDACGFLREFFPHALQLLIVCDCMNRYILICLPDKKEEFLNKKAVGVIILVIIAVSSLFAGLTIQISNDMKLKWQGPASSGSYQGWRRRYTWIYFVALKIIVSFMRAIAHVVLTIRIKINLEKSIAFLSMNMTRTVSIEQYRRIIRFSVYICMIVVFYNVAIASLDAAFFIWKQIHVNYLVEYPFYKNLLASRLMSIMPYLVNVIICFQPFCFASVHIWFKYH